MSLPMYGLLVILDMPRICPGLNKWLVGETRLPRTAASIENIHPSGRNG